MLYTPPAGAELAKSAMLRRGSRDAFQSRWNRRT